MESGDRKLNEAKKVTDMAYVPVIMADGSIGQIAKSDLASVVAGMMGILSRRSFNIPREDSIDINYGNGALLVMWCGVSPTMGLYLLPWTDTTIHPIVDAGGYGSYFNLEVKSRNILTITNVSGADLTLSMSFICL